MTPFSLAALPDTLTWRHAPLTWESLAQDQLTIVAGPDSDWFTDPAGDNQKDNAPAALCTAPDVNFLLWAHVRVAFAASYDAGALIVYLDDNHWAKLAFEYSPQEQPMIVSVVTRDTSDDCNAVTLERPDVYLRVMRRDSIFAFHYSLDNQYWHLARYFSLGPLTTVQLGLAAQSPTGQQCHVTFSEITYQPVALTDIRHGE